MRSAVMTWIYTAAREKYGLTETDFVEVEKRMNRYI